MGKVVEGSSMNYSVNPYSLDELAVSEIKMLEYLIHNNPDDHLNVKDAELGKTIEKYIQTKRWCFESLI